VPRSVGECTIGGVAPIFGEQNPSDEGGVGRRQRPALRVRGQWHREERKDQPDATLRESSHSRCSQWVIAYTRRRILVAESELRSPEAQS
jgi:hypothetical protein